MRALRKKLIGIFAAASLVLATGCVAATTIGGTADRHGLFTGYVAADKATGDGTEIGSYTVVLGLVDVGHDEYATAVKQAEAQGKKVTSKTIWYVFVTKTTAYAK
ncbi:MAG: hypothetical protein FWG12_07160 [Holophagaceae bacterium]|jgi:hypothetical protein|nr:hypothetical protein [Holophagaceae bacterium]